MHKLAHTPDRYLVGLSKRTHPTKAQKDITDTIAQYRSVVGIHPARDTYCVYTDYEGDYTGAYTFFIGSEAPETENILPPLSSLKLPAQACVHIETEKGAMPNIVIQAWQRIWQEESNNNLPFSRLYAADFEVYKATETDPQAMKVDIYVGIDEKS